MHFKAEDAKATVGISDAQDKTNGDVTFFFIDPNDYTGYNIDGLRNADVAFELSRDGKTEHYQPNKSVQVAWDEARVQQMLDDAADQVSHRLRCGRFGRVRYVQPDAAVSLRASRTSFRLNGRVPTAMSFGLPAMAGATTPAR